jgi:hypothetical protein
MQIIHTMRRCTASVEKPGEYLLTTTDNSKLWIRMWGNPAENERICGAYRWITAPRQRGSVGKDVNKPVLSPV